MCFCYFCPPRASKCFYFMRSSARHGYFEALSPLGHHNGDLRTPIGLPTGPYRAIFYVYYRVFCMVPYKTRAFLLLLRPGASKCSSFTMCSAWDPQKHVCFCYFWLMGLQNARILRGFLHRTLNIWPIWANMV